MKLTWSFLCVVVTGILALPGHTQESKDAIRLQVVKYAGLKEAIHKNRGKVVLVDFWADFCLPCKKSFPHIVEMHKRYAPDGLAVISVSLDPIDNLPARDNALRFLQKVGASFTNLYLEEPETFWQKKFGFRGPPCYFVFNRQGQWTKFEPRDDDPNYEAMEKYVVTALREK